MRRRDHNVKCAVEVTKISAVTSMEQRLWLLPDVKLKQYKYEYLWGINKYGATHYVPAKLLPQTSSIYTIYTKPVLADVSRSCCRDEYHS